MRGGILAVVGLLVSALPGWADREHIVQPGETLWLISARLGDPFQWPELYRANRDQIRDPSILYPGQVLTIPDFRWAQRRRPTPGVSAPPPQDPGDELDLQP